MVAATASVDTRALLAGPLDARVPGDPVARARHGKSVAEKALALAQLEIALTASLAATAADAAGTAHRRDLLAEHLQRLNIPPPNTLASDHREKAALIIDRVAEIYERLDPSLRSDFIEALPMIFSAGGLQSDLCGGATRHDDSTRNQAEAIRAQMSQGIGGVHQMALSDALDAAPDLDAADHDVPKALDTALMRVTLLEASVDILRRHPHFRALADGLPTVRNCQGSLQEARGRHLMHRLRSRLENIDRDVQGGDPAKDTLADLPLTPTGDPAETARIANAVREVAAHDKQAVDERDLVYLALVMLEADRATDTSRPIAAYFPGSTELAEGALRGIRDGRDLSQIDSNTPLSPDDQAMLSEDLARLVDGPCTSLSERQERLDHVQRRIDQVISSKALSRTLHERNDRNWSRNHVQIIRTKMALLQDLGDANDEPWKGMRGDTIRGVVRGRLGRDSSGRLRRDLFLRRVQPLNRQIDDLIAARDEAANEGRDLTPEQEKALTAALLQREDAIQTLFGGEAQMLAIAGAAALEVLGDRELGDVDFTTQREMRAVADVLERWDVPPFAIDTFMHRLGGGVDEALLDRVERSVDALLSRARPAADAEVDEDAALQSVLPQPARGEADARFDNAVCVMSMVDAVADPAKASPSDFFYASSTREDKGKLSILFGVFGGDFSHKQGERAELKISAMSNGGVYLQVYGGKEKNDGGGFWLGFFSFIKARLGISDGDNHLNGYELRFTADPDGTPGSEKCKEFLWRLMAHGEPIEDVVHLADEERTFHQRKWDKTLELSLTAGPSHSEAEAGVISVGANANVQANLTPSMWGKAKTTTGGTFAEQRMELSRKLIKKAGVEAGASAGIALSAGIGGGAAIGTVAEIYKLRSTTRGVEDQSIEGRWTLVQTWHTNRAESPTESIRRMLEIEDRPDLWERLEANPNFDRAKAWLDERNASSNTNLLAKIRLGPQEAALKAARRLDMRADAILRTDPTNPEVRALAAAYRTEAERLLHDQAEVKAVYLAADNDVKGDTREKEYKTGLDLLDVGLSYTHSKHDRIWFEQAQNDVFEIA
ncbi:MAG: hypothetical protein AAF713_16025 [Pseudomonadota bacterium]